MEGLGQLNAAFSSPAVGAGVSDWASLIGMDVDAGGVEQVGGVTPLLDPMATSQRMATTPTAAEHSGVAHWSEILNWRDSPMPYLLLVVLLMLGVVQLQVAAKLGRL